MLVITATDSLLLPSPSPSDTHSMCTHMYIHIAPTHTHTAAVWLSSTVNFNFSTQRRGMLHCTYYRRQQNKLLPQPPCPTAAQLYVCHRSRCTCTDAVPDGYRPYQCLIARARHASVPGSAMGAEVRASAQSVGCYLIYCATRTRGVGCR